MYKIRTIWIVILLQPLWACGDGLDQVPNNESEQTSELSDSISQLNRESQKNLTRFMQMFVTAKAVTRRELNSYSPHYSELEYTATLFQLCGASKKLSEVDHYDEGCTLKYKNMEYTQSDTSRYIDLIQGKIGQQDNWDILSVTGENNNRVFIVLIQYGVYELKVRVMADLELQDSFGTVEMFQIDGVAISNVTFD